jgi:hypothetical protein
MLRQVSGGLSRSIKPGQAPPANPVPSNVSSTPSPPGQSTPDPIIGDMLYGVSAGNWGKLAIGSASAILSVSAGIPSWATLLSLLPVHDHSIAAQGGNIPEASITDGTLLARLAAGETVAGLWTFQQRITIPLTDAIILSGTVGGNTWDIAVPPITASRSWTLSDAAGFVLMSALGPGQPAAGSLVYGAGATTGMTKLAIGANGTFLKSTGSAPSWANIAETDITDGSLLARLAANETITGDWTFDDGAGTSATTIFSTGTGSFDSLGLMILESGGFRAKLIAASTMIDDIVISLPAVGGNLVSAIETLVMTNKTLGDNTKIRCGTGATRTLFAKDTSSTVGFKVDTTDLTAQRNIKLPADVAASFVLVGNAASASGVLGKSDLTAQTGSIGSTVLLTGTAATVGVYRVSCYIKTTTAGTALDVVKMTVTSNDGAAQTTDMALWPASQTAPITPILNHDLATNNFASFGRAELYTAASQNIAFTTTVTKTGTPQYSIYVRIETL